jgi:hypothetical protein
MVFAVAASGRLTSRAPLSHSRRASQWIATTILKVTSGSALFLRLPQPGSAELTPAA